MKYSNSSGWGLLSLLATLALAPLSAQARQTDPVAHTKPVIDQPRAHKQVIDQPHAHKQVMHKARDTHPKQQHGTRQQRHD